MSLNDYHIHLCDTGLPCMVTKREWWCAGTCPYSLRPWDLFNMDGFGPVLILDRVYGKPHAKQVCAHACHISPPLMTAKTHDKHCQHKRHETKDALNTLQTIKKTRLAWHEQSALRVREAKGTRHGRQATPVTYPVIKLYLALGA